jgi:hypothetical protein
MQEPTRPESWEGRGGWKAVVKMHTLLDLHGNIPMVYPHY